MTGKDSETPFIKKFKTRENDYIYDVNTNEIIRVAPIIRDIIDHIPDLKQNQIVEKLKSKYPKLDIIRHYKDIQNVRLKNNLFSGHRPGISTGVKNENDIRYLLDSNLEQLILEVSERCNQRCKYCTFSGEYTFNRQHGTNEMSLEIIEKAIDFFTLHSASNRSQLPGAITFYGGEPLLRLDLIKEAVEYTRKIGLFEKYRFSLTTNGTLLTHEAIKYLVANRISILVSLDGPGKIHDKFRVFPDGSGTFASVIQNLKHIKKYSLDYFLNHISFNAVVSPPYPFDDLIGFFFKWKFLEPLKYKLRVSLVDEYETNFFKDFNLENEKENSLEEFARLRKRYKRSLINGTYDKLTIEKALFLKAFHSIARRRIEPLGPYFPPLGTCWPGQRRLLVNVEGNFYMCEKVGSNYPIGNVYTGFDYKRISEFFLEYDDFFKDCSNCWALRLCNKCFNDIRKGSEFSTSRKEEMCKKTLNNIEKNLVTYCEIVEKNPGAFDVFNEVRIT